MSLRNDFTAALAKLEDTLSQRGGSYGPFEANAKDTAHYAHLILGIPCKGMFESVDGAAAYLALKLCRLPMADRLKEVPVASLTDTLLDLCGYAYLIRKEVLLGGVDKPDFTYVCEELLEDRYYRNNRLWYVLCFQIAHMRKWDMYKMAVWVCEQYIQYYESVLRNG